MIQYWIYTNLIVNYGLTLKFPKPDEYSSPEGTREIILKKMAKKDYKSPKMKEVKVNIEEELLAISGGTGGQTCTDASECESV